MTNVVPLRRTGAAPAPRLYTEAELRAAKAEGYQKGVDEALTRFLTIAREAAPCCGQGRPGLELVVS